MGRDLKQKTTVRDAGGDIQGRPADTDIVSSAILFEGVNKATFNFWFTSPSITGKTPTITIEESNSTDIDSFTPIFGANLVDLPEFFKNLTVEGLYIRFKYFSNGATSGTINVDLRKIIER